MLSFIEYEIIIDSSSAKLLSRIKTVFFIDDLMEIECILIVFVNPYTVIFDIDYLI